MDCKKLDKIRRECADFGSTCAQMKGAECSEINRLNKDWGMPQDAVSDLEVSIDTAKLIAGLLDENPKPPVHQRF